MDNQENHAENTVPPAPTAEARKTGKASRPDPETFLANWRQAIASRKDPVPQLRKMATAGFQGEISSEHVLQLVEALAEHRHEAERLALALAVQERFGKPKQLARRLLAEFRRVFEREIGYDPQEFTGYRAPHAMEEWVVAHAPTAPASERDSWFRRFAVCLMNDTETRTVLVGFLAALRRWASSRGLKSSGEAAAFVRAVAQALGPRAISTGKLESILAGAAAVEEQFRQMLNRELTLERQIQALEDSLDHANRRVSGLESSLAAALEQQEKQKARIAELEGSLAEAEQRYGLLDRHWRGVSEQELTKQRERFLGMVVPELEEALLALDRENPNLAIALRRLRHLQEILRK